MDTQPPDPLSPDEQSFADDFERFLSFKRPPGRPTRKYHATGLDEISTRHEQIANWLILNPDKPAKAAAAHFNLHPQTIYYIINSDAFKALLESKHKEVFAEVCRTVPAKLTALADMAIDKVSEQLALSDNPDFAVDVFDKTLHRLGFGPTRQTAPVSVQNTFMVSAGDLSAARGLIIDSSPEPSVGNSGPSAALCFEAESGAGQKTSGD